VLIRPAGSPRIFGGCSGQFYANLNMAFSQRTHALHPTLHTLNTKPSTLNTHRPTHTHSVYTHAFFMNACRMAVTATFLNDPHMDTPLCSTRLAAFACLAATERRTISMRARHCNGSCEVISVKHKCQHILPRYELANTHTHAGIRVHTCTNTYLRFPRTHMHTY